MKYFSKVRLKKAIVLQENDQLVMITFNSLLTMHKHICPLFISYLKSIFKGFSKGLLK